MSWTRVPVVEQSVVMAVSRELSLVSRVFVDVCWYSVSLVMLAMRESRVGSRSGWDGWVGGVRC